MKPTTTQIGVMADQYAHLMAEQAELAKKVKALKQKMLATGRTVFDGAYARVTISEMTGRMAFDSKVAQDMLEAAGWPVPFKPIADSVRFNVSAPIANASVA